MDKIYLKANCSHFTAEYPSSSKKTKNWDKIVHEVEEEEKNEKPEGDAALNKFILDLRQVL